MINIRSLSIKNVIGVLSFSLTLVFLFKTIGHVEDYSVLLVDLGNVLIGICGILLVILSRKTYINKLMVWFLLYLLLNIIICKPPSIFSPYLRLLYMCYVLLVISPIIQNDNFRKLRENSFLYMCVFSVIISLVSFIFYFLGINFFNGDEERFAEYLSHGGWFAGLTKHSMLLGPVSGIASVSMFAMFLKTKKYIYLVIFLLCLSSVLFSASRGALYSVIVSIFVMMFRASKSISVFFRRFAFLFTLSFFLFAFSDTLLSGIKHKYEVRDVDQEGLFASRQVRMEHRMDEFLENPFFGIGFASLDLKYEEEYSSTTGGVEPGTSWLAILSMTGLCGFFLVFLIFFYAFKHSYIESTLESTAKIGVLSMFVVHMLIEGYFYAAGSPLFFMVWLTLGTSVDNKYKIRA